MEYGSIIFGDRWKHVGSKYGAFSNNVPSILVRVQADFCIERMLFTFVMCHSSNRRYPCTHGLVLVEH